MVLTLEKYSEKSLAIFGNWSPFEEKLNQLGGKYNAHLKGRAGWIFRLNMKETLEKFVLEANNGLFGQSIPDISYDTTSRDQAVARGRDVASPPTIPVRSSMEESNDGEIARTISSLQTMIRQFQQQLNTLVDLVEKNKTKLIEPKVEQPSSDTASGIDDVVEKPKSLLRRQ